MNPLFLTDGYKTGHHLQYPPFTSRVYSGFTPRSDKYAPNGCHHVVSFGQQMVMKQIHDAFQNEFFSRLKDHVCGEMKEELSLYLNTDYDVSHFEKLHDLGYLPIVVKAITEGELVPMKIPVLTIYNTHPDFYWLTNYLETIISNLLWKPMTSATIAHEYRKVLTSWQQKTDKEKAWFIDWQGHDFSMRGMDSVDAVISSGLGHLTSFLGSDSLPTIYGARKYYNAFGAVCGSVNATEHSVMCAGSKDDEIGTFRRLLDTFNTGILSIVSDTWDLWEVVKPGGHCDNLKQEIMERDGKVVIRPDSGNPVDILCGYNIETIEADSYEAFLKEAEETLHELIEEQTPHGEEGGDITEKFYWNNQLYDVTYSPDWNRYDKQYYYIDNNGNNISAIEIETLPQHKGVVELLWDVFGGTINDEGYKCLDSHIGAIYGDSITIARANEICQRLEAKGFASTNVVLGIGSFTYQLNTRDTFGFAMKATFVELIEDGVTIGREIFKDPVTDDGIKKSAKGLMKVVKENGEYRLIDQVSWEEEGEGELRCIYLNGQFENQTTFQEIRDRVSQHLTKTGKVTV